VDHASPIHHGVGTVDEKASSTLRKRSPLRCAHSRRLHKQAQQVRHRTEGQHAASPDHY
jgi:hypothetical protein